MNQNAIIWLRRDLRLYDNAALFHALKDSNQVFPVFIFDKKILSKLKNKKDRRIEFILRSLSEIKKTLNENGSDLIVEMGDPEILIPKLFIEYKCKSLYINRDYEKYAQNRDHTISKILLNKNVMTFTFKDQVLFENNEILTQSNNPYTVFTPYKNNHLKKLNEQGIEIYNCENHKDNFAKFTFKALPTLEVLGFEKTNLEDLDLPTGTLGGKNLLEKFYKNIKNYSTNRNFPSMRGVSYLSVHNRFGTLSIRHLAKLAIEADNDGASTWLSELIWRDFYFQIIANFPQVSEKKSFKSQYENLQFENDENKFEAWKNGLTGFPIIDAAMKQINQTGYMHNRLRMIVSSFLVKDLLIDWRWGEKYFEDNLIDFDFSANNGGWQWASSTGCDSQPYFRIFNPVLQSEKFDKDGSFIKKYIPQLVPLSPKEIHQPWIYFEKNKGAFPIKLGIDYPLPIIDHKQQREKALLMYKACK
tara:strand:+ start:1078 stop:2496 length:1419 start_codon:yes stop_codon:yes gene_type:complete